MQHHSLALAVSLALSASPVLAEQNEVQNNTTPDIDHMVVVSSRIAMPLREIATSVSIITQQDIEDRGYASLADVLKAQPSIGVNSSGGAGSTTALRIRGEEGYRTLVRIDGVDISDPTGTQIQTQIGHLQSANLSRVEILRGSQGMAYGADAGGVINITSGSYNGETQGSVAAEYGRYNTTNLNADVGGLHNDFDYYLSASDYSTDGFNSRLSDNLTPDKDGYDNTTIHARVGYQVSDALKLGLVLRNNDGKGEYDGCGFRSTASHDCQSDFEQSNVRLSADYVTGNSVHEFSYAKTLVERQNFNQSVTDYYTKGTTENAEYLGHTAVTNDTTIIYGLDWEQQSITSAQQSRIQRGLYLEVQSEVLSNWFVTAGVRHDDNEDFGRHNSVRISSAYIWTIDGNELKLRGAYGTGFRAPSLYEVQYNRGPYASAPASTTNLQEETTKGYEAGIVYTLSSGSNFEITYFDQKITDGIEFDLVSRSGYLQSLGEAHSKGVELIGDLVLSSNLGLTFNYTYNDTQDTDGDIRNRRPRHLANIGMYYQLDKLRLSANGRSVHHFVDGSVPMKGYEVLDISARYNINDDLSVLGRIENAFDTQYQDLTTYYTSGAAVHAGIKYQF
ncbi:TonB-dependent receptor [Paraglaciecola sp.]|uniref:TonB-dependent receptor plug domain-containing protein n=1 Tax=Paraglaciecola sp. TaxID=1920173 RepID=UPI0030F3E270